MGRPLSEKLHSSQAKTCEETPEPDLNEAELDEYILSIPETPKKPTKYISSESSENRTRKDGIPQEAFSSDDAEPELFTGVPAGDAPDARDKANKSKCSEQSTSCRRDETKKRPANYIVECPETPKKRVGWMGTDARAWCKGEGSPAKGQRWL